MKHDSTIALDRAEGSIPELPDPAPKPAPPPIPKPVPEPEPDEPEPDRARSRRYLPAPRATNAYFLA